MFEIFLETDICKSTVCQNYAKCEPEDGKPVCKCPLDCPQNYKPVCGSDGTTYGNECLMRSTSCTDKITVTVAYTGECGELHGCLLIGVSKQKIVNNIKHVLAVCIF